MKDQKEKEIARIRLLDLLCKGLIVLLFGMTLYCYFQIAGPISTHFNAKGNPNDYSMLKGSIWFMPIITLVTYLIIKRSISFTGTKNFDTLRKWNTAYRGKTDAEIAELSDYIILQLSYMNLMVVLTLSYLTYQINLVAIGKAKYISEYTLWLMIILILAPVVNLLIFQWRRS